MLAVREPGSMGFPWRYWLAISALGAMQGCAGCGGCDGCESHQQSNDTQSKGCVSCDPTGQPCKTSADCSAGYGCASDLFCAKRCKTSADCGYLETCKLGLCAPPLGWDGSGGTGATSDGAGAGPPTYPGLLCASLVQDASGGAGGLTATDASSDGSDAADGNGGVDGAGGADGAGAAGGADGAGGSGDGAVDGASADAPPDGDGSSVDANADAEGGAAVPCPPSAHGSLLVRIGTSCIDATEVTVAQYAEFIAVQPTFSSTSPGCEAVHDSGPVQTGAGCASLAFDPVGGGDLPVVCVTACAARAYCSWAGKSLCGPIANPAGGARYDPWLAACTADGDMRLPYCGPYDPARCQGAERAFDVDSGADGRVPVASAACHGPVAPYDQVHDLIGNVAELQDACGVNNACIVRGGSFATYGELDCETLAPGALLQTAGRYDVGFRCCAQ